MLDIVRREANQPLQPTECQFLQRLAPTISRALAAAFAREQAVLQHENVTAPTASGIVILDSNLRVRYATPAGEAWLALLRDVQRDGHGPLPTAVWSAMASLQAGVDGMVASVILVPTPTGPVRVDASPGGDEGSIAIVLAPVRPATPPDVPESWPLTRQERRVVSLLTLGLSNLQIADELNVSEHTIETHRGLAYEKLGVHRRSQLMSRLFTNASCRH